MKKFFDHERKWWIWIIFKNQKYSLPNMCENGFAHMKNFIIIKIITH